MKERIETELRIPIELYCRSPEWVADASGWAARGGGGDDDDEPSDATSPGACREGESVGRVGSHGRWKRRCLGTMPRCDQLVPYRALRCCHAAGAQW